MSSAAPEIMRGQVSGLREPDPHDPHGVRTPAREHAQLSMFLGTWHIEGSNAPTAPHGADVEVNGDRSYTWLPGEFFLFGRWNHRAGHDAHVGTSIIGWDPDRHSFYAHHYDNLGFAREYALSLHAGVWTFAGRYERASLAFSETHRSFLERWEISKDGSTWRPLCELRGTKLD